jgi:hypothetical protein
MADSNSNIHGESLVEAQKRLAVEALKKRREENDGKQIPSNDSVLYLYCRYCYALIDTLPEDAPIEQLIRPRNNCLDCQVMKDKGWLF